MDRLKELREELHVADFLNNDTTEIKAEIEKLEADQREQRAKKKQLDEVRKAMGLK